MDAVQMIGGRISALEAERHGLAVALDALGVRLDELRRLRDELGAAVVPPAVAERMAAPFPANGNGKAHGEGERPGKPEAAGPGEAPAGLLRDRVARLLAAGPLKTGEIAERLGVPGASVSKVLTRSPDLFERTGGSQSFPYRLTEAGKAAAAMTTPTSTAG